MIHKFNNVLTKTDAAGFKQTVKAPTLQIGIGASLENLQIVEGLLATACDLPIIISSGLAEKLGIQITGETENVVADQQTVVRMKTGLVAVRIVGASITEVPCSISPDGNIYDVIIGAPMLSFFDYWLRGGQLVSIEPNENMLDALPNVEPRFYLVKL